MEIFEFEQYKLFLESLERDETRRETVNQVWVVLNSFGLSALTFLKETNVPIGLKDSILFLIISLIGMLLCAAWILSINSLKYKIKYKRNLLIHLENALGDKLQRKAYMEKKLEKQESILAFSELMVPSLFFIAYLSVMLFLFLFRPLVFFT